MKAIRSGRPDLDLVTGLPKVGPGQFWRLMYYYTGETYGDGYRVLLMEFRPVWWDRMRAVQIRSRPVQLTGDEEQNAVRIRLAAENVLDDQRRDRLIGGMLGDYPPQRLR